MSEIKKQTMSDRLKAYKDKTIDLSKKIVVKGAKGSKWLVENKEYKVTPILAEKLIKQKDATK